MLEKIIATFVLVVCLVVAIVLLGGVLVYVSSFGVIPLIITYIAIISVVIFMALDN